MKIKTYTRVTALFLAVCTVLLMLPLSVRADEYWPDGVKTQSKSAIVMAVNSGPYCPESWRKTDDGAVSVCGYAGVCQ